MKRAFFPLALLASFAPAAVHAGTVVVYGPPPPVYVRPVHHHGYVATPIGNWYTGLSIVGTSIVDQSGGPEQLQSGGGLSAWLGVRVAPQLALEVGYLGSFHNPAPVATWWGTETDYLVLSGVTADAKVHLSSGQPFDPYLQGGVGLYFLGSEHLGTDSVGTGFQAGGGFDVWLGPSVTLGARALYHGIAMGPPDGGENDTFVSAITVEGSVALHF
jgi:outer membrane protein with beta-barrel domain